MGDVMWYSWRYMGPLIVGNRNYLRGYRVVISYIAGCSNENSVLRPE